MSATPTDVISTQLTQDLMPIDYYAGVMDEELRPLLIRLVERLNDGEGVLLIFKLPNQWNQHNVLETTINKITGDHGWNHLLIRAEEWQVPDDEHPLQLLVSTLHYDTTITRLPTILFSQGKAKIKASDTDRIGFAILSKTDAPVHCIRSIAHHQLNMGLNGDLLLHEADIIFSRLQRHQVFLHQGRPRPIIFKTYGAGGSAHQDINPGAQVLSDGVIDIRTHVDPCCIVDYLDRTLLNQVPVFTAKLQKYQDLKSKILRCMQNASQGYHAMPMVHDVLELINTAAEAYQSTPRDLMCMMQESDKRYYGEIAYSTPFESHIIYRLSQDLSDQPFKGYTGQAQAMDQIRSIFRQMSHENQTGILHKIIAGTPEPLFPEDNASLFPSERLQRYAASLQYQKAPSSLAAAAGGAGNDATEEHSLSDLEDSIIRQEIEIEKLQEKQKELIQQQIKKQSSSTAAAQNILDLQIPFKDLHNRLFVANQLHQLAERGDYTVPDDHDGESDWIPVQAQAPLWEEHDRLSEEMQGLTQQFVNQELSKIEQWSLQTITEAEQISSENTYFFHLATQTFSYTNGVGTNTVLTMPEEIATKLEDGSPSILLDHTDIEAIGRSNRTHAPDESFATKYIRLEKEYEDLLLSLEISRQQYRETLQQHNTFSDLFEGNQRLLAAIVNSMANYEQYYTPHRPFEITTAGGFFFVAEDKDAASRYGSKLVEMENHLFNEVVHHIARTIEVQAVHITKLVADPAVIEPEITAALNKDAETACMTLDDYMAAYRWAKNSNYDEMPDCGRWRAAEHFCQQHPHLAKRFYNYSKIDGECKIQHPFWKEIGTDLLKEIADGKAFQFRKDHDFPQEQFLKSRASTLSQQSHPEESAIRALFQDYLTYMNFGAEAGTFKIYRRTAPGFLEPMDDWDMALYKSTNTAMLDGKAFGFIDEPGLIMQQHLPFTESDINIERQARALLQMLRQAPSLNDQIMAQLNSNLMSQIQTRPQLESLQQQIEATTKILLSKRDLQHLIAQLQKNLNHCQIDPIVIQTLNQKSATIKQKKYDSQDLYTEYQELKRYIQTQLNTDLIQDPRLASIIGRIEITLEFIISNLLWLLSVGQLTYCSATTKTLRQQHSFFNMTVTASERCIDQIAPSMASPV